jgi:molybdenum cofactor cytidylyltransferase
MIRVAAIVPAAGRSQRMGRPKLTLGLGTESVIQRVVIALEHGGAEPVLVVAPPVAEPDAVVLANHAKVEGAWVVHCPRPTTDMRGTVRVGLDELASQGWIPDGLLIAPGDSPGLSPRLVGLVVERFRQDPSRIVVPRYEGRRGHPVALPWPVALAIHELPDDVGINALLDQQASLVTTLEVNDPGAIADMDTPEEYRKWAGLR